VHVTFALSAEFWANPREAFNFFGVVYVQVQQTSVSSLHCVLSPKALHLRSDEGAIFDTGAIARRRLPSPVHNHSVSICSTMRAVDCGNIARDM
jgi:hypothetical protein